MATLSTPNPVRTSVVMHKLASNATANILRLAITSLVSLALPPYLTHHLSKDQYGAWVLVLQLAAYVGFLDLGVQTAVSKFIAEYDMKEDHASCNRCASSAVALMLIAGTFGTVLTVVLAWLMPQLFQGMPVALYPSVRTAVLLVGISLSVSLATGPFVAIFMGLQRYSVPTTITVITRLLYAGIIVAVVMLHGSIAAMGVATACVNLLTAALQLVAWKRFAGHIAIRLSSLDRNELKRMLGYCVALVVISTCTLFVSGLDLAIVGHYSFAETAYYAVATAPTSFVLMVGAAVMGPLLPAVSALSVGQGARHLGNLLVRITRCNSAIIVLLAIPFLVAGRPILAMWVGESYASHSQSLLTILIVANIIRSICAPYATMLVAAGQQKVAPVSAIVEGLVNLSLSIWLARYRGAAGVAMGTLVGGIVGVAVHFAVSMRLTRNAFMFSRAVLLREGVLRPALILIPTVPFAALIGTGNAVVSPLSYVELAICTCAMAVFAGVSKDDRRAAGRIAIYKLNAMVNGKRLAPIARSCE